MCKMEGFTSNIHSFKPSFSFIDTDHNMELRNQFSFQYDNISESFMGSSYDNFLSQQVVLPSFDHQLVQNFPHEKKNVIMSQEAIFEDPIVNGKRKTIDVSASSTSRNSSSHSSSEKGKKAKLSDNGEAQKEEVRVRARRGQATDSHSLAERVRRGKITERLRCLQDIVPGCYKSMGMAVMLDEIINYVQSLQNQVEFLSMKLTEASRFHDFDSDSTHIDTFQMGNVIEGLKM